MRGGAESHYPVLSDREVQKLPVFNIASPDCALFLWCTWPKLKEGIATVEGWGFEYKTVAFVWVKLNKKNKKPFFGLGRWCNG